VRFATIRALADTLEDRAIVVQLQRKPRAASVARLRKRDSEEFPFRIPSSEARPITAERRAELVSEYWDALRAGSGNSNFLWRQRHSYPLREPREAVATIH
jgi:hypothetical protein